MKICLCLGSTRETAKCSSVSVADGTSGPGGLGWGGAGLQTSMIFFDKGLGPLAKMLFFGG